MVEAVRPGNSTPRLVDQLNALSQLTESLAFRVVELEERLAATENQLKPLLAEPHPARLADDTELRLEDTEERIARLESLLNGAAMVGMGKGQLALLNDQDPFIDEGEQPFMDDLVA